MILPDDAKVRHSLFRNLIRECEGDREQRRARHLRYRNLLLLGTDGARQARYNKLAEHVKTSTSFLYSATAARFGVTLPPKFAGEANVPLLEAASTEMHRLWRDTDAGLTFGQGVKWSHADDSSVFKVITDEGVPRVELVPDPSDIGVWRPDITEWARQEAIVHWFYVDLPTFQRYLRGIPNEELRNVLWVEAQEHATPHESPLGDALPGPVQSLLIAQSSPTAVGAIYGGVNNLLNFSLCRPDVRSYLVQMAELWVYDDQAIQRGPRDWKGDYRKIWMLRPTERVMWEDVNPLVPGEHPFHGLSLDPVPGYIWGRCPLEELVRLQGWRELRMDQVDALMALQLEPPLHFVGFSGEMSELRKRFWQQGGAIGSPVGNNGKIENLAPAMPPEAFAEIAELDRMFASMGGLPLGSQGRTEPGVRSGEQAQLQAMLGAGPTADRAMLVERCAENIATQMFRLRRLKSADRLRTNTGEEFLLTNLPPDVTVKVSAHSASPLYGQEVKQLAVLALQLGAIDAEDFIKLADLPMQESLIPKARERAKAAAEVKNRVLTTKEAEAKARNISALSRLAKAEGGG